MDRYVGTTWKSNKYVSESSRSIQRRRESRLSIKPKYKSRFIEENETLEARSECPNVSVVMARSRNHPARFMNILYFSKKHFKCFYFFHKKGKSYIKNKNPNNQSTNQSKIERHREQFLVVSSKYKIGTSPSIPVLQFY